ncbi:ski oncogene isoform X2 [Neocloeon triangulifer]|uniref:ski oncogene isoform X2 n=1 Tax=Neocloeon triangulifer TaxID=2078957 RepID=UPI00286EC77E|nr:ski oncogene isoform X2 [Neocloeon triangulifer]
MMETVVNGGGGGAAGLDKQQHHRMYSPHLKKVLKTYQLTAQRSLKGPAGVSGETAKEACKAAAATAAEDQEPPAAPAAPKQQHPPVFYTQDRARNSELQETVLRGANISCFNVGGELRLCLPQVFNYVLNGFQPPDIYQQCDELHIHCNRCSPEQLDVLKGCKKLPETAVSCGLITQTDAERLCGALLNSANARSALPCKPSAALRVYHECFGKCHGLLTPSLFAHDESECVECCECQRMYSPQDFVTHVHSDLENSTCHWGFDSAKWRAYLLLDEDQDNFKERKDVLVQLKQRRVVKYDKPHKRKQVCLPPRYYPNEVKSAPTSPVTQSEFEDQIKAETPPPHGPLVNGKRQRLHYDGYLLPPEPQTLYTSGPPPYSFHDPFHYAWLQHDWAARMAITYRNWSIPPTKEAIKGLQVRDPMTLSFLSHAPPILMNPNRVVPFSESDRFESQPNVALAPLSQSLQRSSAQVRKEVSASLGKEPKQEPVQRPSSTTAPVHLYNPEIELSTDTEDSNSANGVEDETPELLSRLVRCVQETEGDTRRQGEAALNTLSASLIATREAHKALATEFQLMKDRVEQLEARLCEERAQHDKEIAAMSLDRLRTAREHHVVVQHPHILQNGSPQRTSPATSVITSSSAIVKKEPLNVD